jgi:predicted small lipoprotein YifL
MQALKIRSRSSLTLKTLAHGLLVAALASFLGCGGGGPAIELPPDPKTASQATLESLFSQITGR